MVWLVTFGLLLQAGLLDICPAFGVPDSGVGYDRAYVEYALDADAINALLAIDGDSFWVGYERGGFAWADDVQPVLTVTLWMADGDERWIDVYGAASTPEVYYVLPYANTVAYADSNGEHWGTHPCAAVTISAGEFEAIMAEMAT
jgi:hypothetical protein